MNIWSLDKDISIKHLLLMLRQSLSDELYEIVIGEETSKAIRLRNKNDNSLSVYIYTYGQDEERYGVHLEYPELDESNVNNTLEIYENLKYSSLSQVIKTHLNLI